jgi:hypothetical protein
MKQLLLQFVLFTSFFTNIHVSYSQSYALSPLAKASVLTCDKGDELYSLFGHTALRIKDSINGVDVVFNYGMFDFNTPNFYLKFVKGDLQYFVDNSTFENFIHHYRADNRSVYEQTLNLSPNQVQNLLDELNGSLFSKDRFYTYKFIDKNCTTMVVDKIESVFGEKCIHKKSHTDISYRAVLNPYLEHHFYEKLGINILFGYKTDQDATQLFLPLELMESISKTKVDDKKISTTTKILFEKDKSIATYPWWNSIYTFIVLLFLVLLTNNSKVYITFLLVLGILGIVLSSIGLYSSHKEVLYNYNILLFNPLLLVLLFFYRRRNKKWFKKLYFIVMTCLALFFIILLNKVQLIPFLPLITTSALILWRLYIKIIPPKQKTNSLLTAVE